MTPSSKPPTVKLWVRPARSTALWQVTTWLALAGTVTLAGAIAVAGVRLIVNPYSDNWLKSAFPALGPTEAAPVQSLSDIRTELQSQGLALGTAVRWRVGPRRTDWIFPVLRQPSGCAAGQTDCATPVALRVYRLQPGSEDRFQLANTIDVQGPKESFVTAPLLGTASQVARVDRPAALAQLTLFETPLDDTPWLMLENRRQFGTTTIRYGQIFHYSPRSSTVTTLLTWTSPADSPPTFQDLDGQAPPELLVNQTVGLEPSLQAYTFINTDPPQLKEISLLGSVFAAPPATSVYGKALQLARSGVWSHALQMMETARQTLGKDWSTAAEAQLNLIAAHAQITHAQAERDWSSRPQKTLVYLIDGQWEQALADLEARPISSDRLLEQMENNFNRLWRRVQAHLQIHPTDPAAQVWGALLVTARQDPAAATAWLEDQRATQTTQERFEALLAKGPVIDGLGNTAATGLSAPRYRGLVGSVTYASTPITQERWQLQANALPPLAEGQTWYQIDVQALGTDQRWSAIASADLTDLDQSAWTLLGLEASPWLDLMAWGEAGTASTPIMVRGVRRDGGRLLLLAAGNLVPLTESPPALALTPGSLRWLDAQAGTPVGQLVQSDSTWNAQLTQLTTSPTLGALYPYLKAFPLELTGDSTPELVLRLDPNELPPGLGATGGSWPSTLIFSASGEQLYSDVGTAQSVVALVPGSPTLPTGLLVHEGATYRLQTLP